MDHLDIMLKWPEKLRDLMGRVLYAPYGECAHTAYSIGDSPGNNAKQILLSISVYPSQLAIVRTASVQ